MRGSMKKTFEEREQLILQLFADKHYVPMKEKELAILLRVESEDREELSRVLVSLLEKRITEFLRCFTISSILLQIGKFAYSLKYK